MESKIEIKRMSKEDSEEILLECIEINHDFSGLYLPVKKCYYVYPWKGGFKRFSIPVWLGKFISKCYEIRKRLPG